MKRVIRLTESDLTRIVKRVIKEQSSEVIKAKAWSTADERDKQSPRGTNLDITNTRLHDNEVLFDYENPGGLTDGGQGKAYCDGGTIKDAISITGWGRTPAKDLYLTPESFKKITKLCDAYTSNGAKTNGDYV